VFDVRRTDSCLLVEGNLDSEGAQTFLLAVASERGPVRVDASRVARIDAAGLTALAVARSRCRAEGRTFALTRVAPDAVRGLRVGDDVLRLFQDHEQAREQEQQEEQLRDEPGGDSAPRHRRDRSMQRDQPTTPARSHGHRFSLRFTNIHRHHGS
jgi:anti-anti-sigma regulatory factor